MDINGKWLARAGALLVMLGFVMPSMLVSCSGMPEMGTSFSLAQLASQAEQPLLYLAPVAALALLILTLLPMFRPSQIQQLLIGQLAAGALSLLSILIPLIAVNSQISQLGGAFAVTPQFGSFVLVGGFVLIGIGLVKQWNERQLPSSYRESPEASWSPPPPAEPPWWAGAQVVGQSPPQGSAPEAPPADQFTPPAYSLPERALARLNLVQGSYPKNSIPLTGDDILLGRSSECNIPLQDPAVSRRHARLRYAQGHWFIQDQESRGGTFVNGQQVQAARLSDGDTITLGDTTFKIEL